MERDSLLIRRVPSLALENLKAMAKARGRSLEGEGREALLAWTGSRVGAADRLNHALAEFNSSRFRKKLSVTELGEMCGEDSARGILTWFSGEDEPPYLKLEKVARCLNVDERWLKHGVGSPYQRVSLKLTADLTEMVRELLMPAQNGNTSLKQLIFVRLDKDSGEVAVVREFGDLSADVWVTPFYLRQDIGAQTEHALMQFYLLLEFLRAGMTHGTLGLDRLPMKSVLVSEPVYNQIVSGQVLPTSRLENRMDGFWWEEIWNESLNWEKQGPFWNGCEKLSKRIQASIRLSPEINTVRRSIRDGTHPLLSRNWRQHLQET